MVTSVDEDQIHRHNTSDQKPNDNNKTSPLELIPLAKLSAKVLFTLLALILATLTFLLYLNDKETQKKLTASVNTTVSARGGALDAEIYSIVEYIKRLKSITDRHLLKSPDFELAQTSIKRIEETAVYHKKGDHSHLVKGTTVNNNEVLGSIIVGGKFNDQQWSRLKWILLGLDLFDSQEAEHSNSKNITLSYFGFKRDHFISTYPAIDVAEILSEQEGNAAKWFDYAFEVYEPFVSGDWSLEFQPLRG